MGLPLRVLIVEDSVDDTDLILRELRRMGMEPTSRRVETAAAMREALRDETWDAVLSDYRLPQFSAPAALVVLRESGCDLPFIIVSGSIGEDSAVAVLKEGAHDFITKGMLARLTTAIDREMREAANRRAHREAHSRAQESAQRINTLVTMSPIGHVLFDRQGVVSVWNPAAERIFGYAASEVVGHPLPSCGTDFHPIFVDMCERAWNGTTFTSVEANMKTKDGRIVLVSTSLVPLVAAGASAGIGDLMLLFEDITERKGLERQLFQAQKMDAIGKLAGGVAHDFNNLLTVINGRSHRMLGKLQPEDPLWREADIIYQTGERAARLVRQLLAFSRKQIAQPQAMDLNAVISDLAKVLKSLLGEGIELATVLEPGLKSIKADPAQIEQVVINLVVNASDAMPQGGRLTIQTSNVRIDEAQARLQLGALAGAYVCLSVTDTGLGMDEATQARIFEPFFTTKAQGSGLGLATAYGIIKHAGGFIVADSALGRGSLFSIHLPASQAAHPDHVLLPGRSPLHGSEQVLVVEDEDDVRSLVVQILEVHGYQVKAARNWVEAFGIAKRLEGRIHLLLTDVVMPQMSGREIAASLMPLCPGMKVLYMSGYTDSAIVQHGVLESGINFLQKPFSPDVLLRAVREVFDPA